MSDHTKVFISYSHQDVEYEDIILRFADQLSSYGIDVNIDLYEESPAEGWQRWVENQINNSDFVLVVSSKSYYEKCYSKSKRAKGVSWEVNIFYQSIYDMMSENTKFIPVYFDIEDEQYILKPLKPFTFYNVGSQDGFEKLCRRLSGIDSVSVFPEKVVTYCSTKTEILRNSKQSYDNSRKPGNRFCNLNIVSVLLPQGVRSCSYFVEYARVKGESVAPINEILSKYADNNISIIGEGGIGKTTLLVRLMEQFFANTNNQGAVPIFVELNRCSSKIGGWISEVTGVSNFIARFIAMQITKKLELNAVPPEAVSRVMDEFNRHKENSPEYLLLLDGFNEVNHDNAVNSDGTETGSTIRQLLINEIHYLMGCPNVRVIITSRKVDIVYFNENAVNVELVGLKQEAVTGYLKEQHFDEITINTVSSNYALMDCLRIPLFLCMFAANENLQGMFRPETRGEILFSFFNSQRGAYNETAASERINFRSAIKSREVMFIRDFILPYIGWWMQKEEKFNAGQSWIGKKITYFMKNDMNEFTTKEVIAFPTYQNESESINDIRRSLLTHKLEDVLKCIVGTLSVMYRDEKFNYSFIHHHIRDYFAGMYEIQWLRLSRAFFEDYKANRTKDSLTSARKALNSITSRIWTYDQCVIIGEVLSEQRNKPAFIGNEWTVSANAAIPEQLLLKSALDVFRILDYNVYCGVTNIIEVLKAVRRNLAGENFSKLDLSQCNLYETNFSIGTQSNGLFANFSRSIISDTTFKQPGHLEGIMEYRYASKGEALITISTDGTAKKWDAETGTCLHAVEMHNGLHFLSDVGLCGFECSGDGLNFTIILTGKAEVDNESEPYLVVREFAFNPQYRTSCSANNLLSIHNPLSEMANVRYSVNGKKLCILFNNTFSVYKENREVLENSMPFEVNVIFNFALTDEYIYVLHGNKEDKKFLLHIERICIDTSVRCVLYTFETFITEYNDKGIGIIDEMLFVLHPNGSEIFFSEPGVECLRRLSLDTTAVKDTALECSYIVHCTFAADDEGVIFALRQRCQEETELVAYDITFDNVIDVYYKSNTYFYTTGNHLRHKLLLFDQDFYQPMEWDIQRDKFVSKYLFGGVGISCALFNEHDDEIIFLFQNDCMYTVDAKSMKYKYGLFLGAADAIIHLTAFDYQRNILWLLFESTNREKEYIMYYNLNDMTNECLYYKATEEHNINTIFMSCSLDALFIATYKDIIMLDRNSKTKVHVYSIQENERILEMTYDDTNNCLIVILCYKTDEEKYFICPQVKKFIMLNNINWLLQSWYSIPILEESELNDFVKFRDISQMSSYTHEFRLNGYCIFSGIFYKLTEVLAERIYVQEYRYAATGEEIVTKMALSQTEVNYYLVRMAEKLEDQIETISTHQLIDYDYRLSAIVTLDCDSILSLARFKDGEYQVKSQFSIIDLGVDCIDGILSPYNILYFWGDNLNLSDRQEYSVYALDFTSRINKKLNQYDPGVMIDGCDFTRIDANDDVKSFLKDHGGAGIMLK